MLFYPFNIREYRKDTMHLSALEHGIYRLLLDTYYLEDGHLEADEKALMRRHCVRTDEEKEAFMSVIDEFFCLRDGVYRHSKCDEVIAEVMEKSEKAKASAQKRWEKHRAKAMRTHSEGNADGMLNKEKEKDNNYSSKPSVPPCPVEQIIKIYKETATRLPGVRVVPDSVKAQISARWRDDEKFRNLDFWKVLFSYCENHPFLSGQIDRGDKRPWRASLAWIVKPSNFAKIVNEEYE